MRLIKTDTLEIVERFNNIPEYAILSHTWGDHEVTFSDWKDLKAACQKKGFHKIKQACDQARRDGIDYAWVDTNCIDKTSSSELSEAINSMFAWYQDSKVCYVFLEDVHTAESSTASDASATDSHHDLDVPAVRKAFRGSKWFRRGWTLQELLAPSRVNFYSAEWTLLGSKDKQGQLINEITGIGRVFLAQPDKIPTASVAHRMSWMTNRKTTRIEDTAYCLLGIFGINMTLLYGEGHGAFLRLQEEIIRISNDQTIFCWQARQLESDPATFDASVPSMAKTSMAKTLLEDAILYDAAADGPHRKNELENWTSMLAPHPCLFRDAKIYSQLTATRTGSGGASPDDGGLPPVPAAPNSASRPYAITNLGLSITLPLLHTAHGAYAVLDVRVRQKRRDDRERVARVVVPLHRVQSGHYVRLATHLLVMPVPASLTATRDDIFVDCRNTSPPGVRDPLHDRLVSQCVDMHNIDEEHPLLLLTFSRAVDIQAPSSIPNANFEPFHSFVEVANRSRTYAAPVATILQGHASAGGHDSANGSVPDPGSGSGAGLFRLLLSYHHSTAASPAWHISVHKASDISAMLKPHVSGARTDAVGSWFPSPELKNVLAWPYSPGGAFVCYLELGKFSDDVTSQTRGEGLTAASPDEERKAFAYLRRAG